jgi:hypothetical protein
LQLFWWVAGYRVIVASTAVSTYGVEAPAARAHGARFERYVLGALVQPLETVQIIPVPRSLLVPILGDALYGGATTTSLHFSTYAGIIPEDRLFLHSSSISFWVRTFS